MIHEDQKILCPYCCEPNWLEIDPTESDNQVFIQDCEICCRPIQIHSSIDENGEWHSSANAENF